MVIRFFICLRAFLETVVEKNTLVLFLYCLVGQELRSRQHPRPLYYSLNLKGLLAESASHRLLTMCPVSRVLCQHCIRIGPN